MRVSCPVGEEKGGQYYNVDRLLSYGLYITSVE